MKRLSQTVLIVALTSIASGCATTKDELLPQSGPTMEEVYKQQVLEDEAVERQLNSDQRPRRELERSEELHGYTREAHTELQSMFPQLPNPTLVMFVYPHLSTESRLPVPGYSTSFQMYERTEYALPGEL